MKSQIIIVPTEILEDLQSINVIVVEKIVLEDFYVQVQGYHINKTNNIDNI
jgi:hypothetical protein